MGEHPLKDALVFLIRNDIYGVNRLLNAKDKKIQKLIDTLQLFSKEQFSQCFKSDDDCLAFLFNFYFFNHTKCSCCFNNFIYVLIKTESIYQCVYCENQIDPTVDTPFNESLISLRMWFNELFSLKKYPLSQRIELMRIVNLSS